MHAFSGNDLDMGQNRRYLCALLHHDQKILVFGSRTHGLHCAWRAKFSWPERIKADFARSQAGPNTALA